MKKKITPYTVVILVFLLTACLHKDNPLSDFGIVYFDGGKYAAIAEYYGSKTEVRIPTKNKELPVTLIVAKAFAGKNIISINIPDSVTEIGFCAFYNNPLMKKITIPDNVNITEAIVDFEDPYYTFPYGFTTFYKSQGSKAGTYIYSNGIWRIK